MALDPNKNSWTTGRWLVEGDPGSGKTTLLRHLAGRLAKANDHQHIPIFVSLPRLVEPPRSLVAYLDDEYGGLLGRGLSKALDQAGKDGQLIVLLDGLDEVPPERRERAQRVLSKIGRDWKKSRFVLSSRPLGLGEPPPDFVKLLLQPLDDEQRLSFLEKWFKHRHQSEAREEAERAARHFDAERSLRELSRNPLHLTLLTVLWEQNIRAPRRRSELYDAIFKLLLNGEHKNPPVAIDAVADVREALGVLAYGMTEDDLPVEAPEHLAQRLRAPENTDLRCRLETVWKTNLQAFLNDVHERTYIFGPHDGKHGGWRFWHRTFREALTAERLAAIYEADGEGAILQFAEEIEGELGRWAEPFALLGGRVEESDRLVTRLVKINRSLGLRALATAQGLRPKTLRDVLRLTDDWKERRKVFEALVEQVDEPDASLALIDQLRSATRDGNDLFFLDAAAREVGRRWPSHDGRVDDLLRRFHDHFSPPPEDLFRTVATCDGNVPLWRTIPAGRFRMGSPDGEGEDDEHPQHEVIVKSAFRISAVPVTVEQYSAFDPAYGNKKRARHPVGGVSWFAAMAFCRWLSAAFPGARLPTEEEWEYAARAGTKTRYWSGDTEEDLARVGWYRKNSDGRSHAVGEKPANVWGLYDVHGNVGEWTLSEWPSDYESRRDGVEHDPAAVRPAAAAAASASGGRRVIRGGSCRSSTNWARVADRDGNRPEAAFDDLGFRVVLPVAPSSVVDP